MTQARASSGPPSGQDHARPERQGQTPRRDSHHAERTRSAGRDPADNVWCDADLELDDSNRVTALVHLYRAEVGRANLWRNRLDATTNWAVVTTAGALTFSFGSAENPHFLLLLVLLLVLTFLIIEARRYIYYALWYHRVRLLETGFLSTMLSPLSAPSAEWSEPLGDSLQNPEFVTSRWRAIANRCQHNYIWLISLIIISWLLKLSVHPMPISALEIIVSRARIGQWVPGAWVIGAVGLLYLTLLGLIAAGKLIPKEPTARQPRERGRTQRGQEQMAIIITTHRELVSRQIMDQLCRGVTAVKGIGMYTGQARDVLFTAIPSSAEAALRGVVERTDPEAFIILIGARDIRGRGFAPTEPPA